MLRSGVLVVWLAVLLFAAGPVSSLPIDSAEPALARAPGSRWTCVEINGTSTAITLVGVDEHLAPACHSVNGGKDCLWFSTSAECAAALSPLGSPTQDNILICGSENYKSRFGNSGFPGGWCDSLALPSPNSFFRCLPGLHTPVKLLSTGNVACLKNEDDDGCNWGGSCDSAGALAHPRSSSLECGSKDYFDQYGDYGYGNKESWCCRALVTMTSSVDRPGALPADAPFACSLESGSNGAVTAKPSVDLQFCNSLKEAIILFKSKDLKPIGAPVQLNPRDCQLYNPASSDIDLLVYSGSNSTDKRLSLIVSSKASAHGGKTWLGIRDRWIAQGGESGHLESRSLCAVRQRKTRWTAGDAVSEDSVT